MARRQGKRFVDGDGELKVADKAGNGEGSIYWVADRGVYKATYFDAAGKRRTVSGRTKAEAAARRDAKLEAARRATPSGRLGTDPTVAAVATWWLEDVAAATVRPSTLHAYGKDVARINAKIGGLPIAELDIETVRSLLAELRRDGRKAGTITNTRARLRQIAQAAVELGYLTHNPVSAVRTPKAPAEQRTRRRVLTATEVRQLLGALGPDRRYDAAICLLFTSGIRVNEALGLAWSDLDLDVEARTGTATLRRGCTYEGGGVGARLDNLKTTATAGVHHLAPTAVTMLEARRVAQEAEKAKAGKRWPQHRYEGELVDLVFTTPAGALAKRQNVQQALNDACQRAGIDPDRIGTHTGRRSTVTALYVDGVPIDDIARHVGHTDPATTARYVQDLGTRPAATALRASELLDPSHAAGSAS
jgi:integrase